MRRTILAIAGASSLLLGSAAALLDLNEGSRALQRANDMQDTTQMTSDEVQRLRSLMESGRLHVVRRGDLAFERPSSPDNKNNLRSRTLATQSEPKQTPRTVRKLQNTPFDDFVFDDDTDQVVIPVDPAEGDDESMFDDGAPFVGDTDDGRPVMTDDGAARDDDLAKVTVDVDGLDDALGVWVDDAVDDMVFPTEVADDTFVDEEGLDVEESATPVLGELQFVSIYLEGYQDGMFIINAIPPNPDFPDEFDAGAVYIYDKESIYGVTTDSTSRNGNSTNTITVDIDDEFASVSGQCIRTDPFDELDDGYLGRAYCHFVYTHVGLLDELIAEGPVEIGKRAALTVTGGNGIYRRAAGEVVLTSVETASFPDVFESFGDLPASYYMQVYLYMNAGLVPAEVFET